MKTLSLSLCVFGKLSTYEDLSISIFRRTGKKKEKQDRAQARRFEAHQVKIKATKFKRTVHVAFSADLS
jgi:hypothetical protein